VTSHSRLRVLWADDDGPRRMRGTCEGLTRSMPVDVDFAVTVEATISRLRSIRYSVLLLDQMLTGESPARYGGVEVVNALCVKQAVVDFATPSTVPIVVISAAELLPEIKQIRGDVSFLRKPFLVSELVECLESIVR